MLMKLRNRLQEATQKIRGCLPTLTLSVKISELAVSSTTDGPNLHDIVMR